MGAFDLEYLKNTINKYKFLTVSEFNDLPSRDTILTTTVDGKIYEIRKIKVANGALDEANQPTLIDQNVLNPIFDYHKVSEEEAKEIMDRYTDKSVQFAYITKDQSETKYDKLKNNTQLLLPLSRAFHRVYPDAIFNENIFRVTKLREDIMFINVDVVQMDKPLLRMKIAVNNSMFWKRFDVQYRDPITSELKPINKSLYFSANDLIHDILIYPSQFYIKMRYLNTEKAKIDEYNSTNKTDDIVDLDLSAAVIEFTGCVSYNKRTWIELFTPGIGIKYTEPEDMPDIGSYKIKGSNTYYPGDEDPLCQVYR